jgi:FMN phosphatase YigB (HAD superfamily)
VTAVAFDVGETLVDETGMWERAADLAGVPRFTLMGVLGGLAARGERHSRVWELVDSPPPSVAFGRDEFYPDALAALARVRAVGYHVAIVGNTGESTEDLVRPYADVIGSSARWGVEKPATEFFARLQFELDVPAASIAYVGDRVDNDVEPALAAGMVAVHIRRGPWGYLHEPPPEAISIRSLDELPDALP